MYWANNLPSAISTGQVTKEVKYPNLGEVCSTVLAEWVKLLEAQFSSGMSGEGGNGTTPAGTMSTNPFMLFSLKMKPTT
jgi:hypothetical protein